MKTAKIELTAGEIHFLISSMSSSIYILENALYDLKEDDDRDADKIILTLENMERVQQKLLNAFNSIKAN